MKRTIIESPYSERDKIYLSLCRLDALRRGEAPFSRHQFLDLSRTAEQHRLALSVLVAWEGASAATTVYADFGITPDMQEGLDLAEKAGHPVIYRVFPRGFTQPAEDVVVSSKAQGGQLSWCAKLRGQYATNPDKGNAICALSSLGPDSARLFQPLQP